MDFLLHDQLSGRLPAPANSSDAGPPADGAPVPKAPLGFVYGARIRLRHAATGRHLHSHRSTYPEREEHNIVTCFAGECDNDWWVVQPTAVDEQDPPRGPVPHGGAIRLQHWASSRYLCSGQAVSHVAPSEWEVSAAAREDAVSGDQWRCYFSFQHAHVRLQHDSVGLPPEAGRPVLHSRAGQHYPQWGYHQQEVSVAAVAFSDAAEHRLKGLGEVITPAGLVRHPEAALDASAMGGEWWGVVAKKAHDQWGGSRLQLGLSGRLPSAALPPPEKPKQQQPPPPPPQEEEQEQQEQAPPAAAVMIMHKQPIPGESHPSPPLPSQPSTNAPDSPPPTLARSAARRAARRTPP